METLVPLEPMETLVRLEPMVLEPLQGIQEILALQGTAQYLVATP